MTLGGVRKDLGEPVGLSLRAQVDLIVTGKRYEALGEPRSEAPETP